MSCKTTGSNKKKAHLFLYKDKIPGIRIITNIMSYMKNKRGKTTSSAPKKEADFRTLVIPTLLFFARSQFPHPDPRSFTTHTRPKPQIAKEKEINPHEH
jgi:hypothetical protein